MGDEANLLMRIEALELRIQELEAEALIADETEETLNNAIAEKDDRIEELESAIDTVDNALSGLT